MKRFTLLALSAALVVPSAFSGTVTYNAANAPNGTHVQRGTPDCQVSGYVVTCSS